MATSSLSIAPSTPNLFTLALQAKPAPLAATPATNLTPQVHLLLLLPTPSLSSAALPTPSLLQALHAHLRTQHPGARVLASSVSYPRRTSALTRRPACKAWTELQLDASAEQAGDELELLIGNSGEEMELEGLENEEEGAEKGDVLKGLIAAIEHFAALSPLPSHAAPTSLEPPRAPIQARHILHLSSAPLALPPQSTALATALNSQHDTWSLHEAAQRLRDAGVSVSTLILPGAEAGKQEVGVDARALHVQLGAEGEPTATEEQVKTLLGGATAAEVALPQGAVLLVRGLLNTASATTSTASLKRSRSKASASPGASALGAGAEVQGDTKRRKGNVASAAVVPPTVPADTAARTLLSRVMFLQQQVSMMMNHLTLAARNGVYTASGGAASDGAGAKEAERQVAIEKLRAKLAGVRMSFQSQHAQLAAGGQAPELNASIAALLAVNAEAAQLGIELGLRAAAASAQAGTASGSNVANTATTTTTAAQAQLQAQAHAQAQAVATANAQAAQAQAQAQPPTFPSRAQPIWQGPICWSVTDPSTGAKREVQTIVSATASTKTFSGNMSLPWPARLLMQSTIPMHMPSLHAFGMRNTPCVLFTSKSPPGGDSDALRTAQNEEAYKGFAHMLEQRKLCGFIPWREGHGAPPGGGILVVATPTPPTGQNANVRLFGLILNDSEGLKTLVAAATAAQRGKTQQQQQLPNAGVPAAAAATNPTNAAAPLFQSSNPPAQGQAQGAGQGAGYTQQQLDLQRQVALQLQNARQAARVHGLAGAQAIMAQHQQQQGQGQAQQRGAVPGAGVAGGTGVGAGGFTTQPSLAQVQPGQTGTGATSGFVPPQQQAQQGIVAGPPGVGSAWNFPTNPAAVAYAASSGASGAAAGAGAGVGVQRGGAAPTGATSSGVAGGGGVWNPLAAPGGISAADMASLSAQLGLTDPTSSSSTTTAQNQNLWGNWSTAQPSQQAQGNQGGGNQQPDYALLQRLLNGSQQQQQQP